MRMIIVKCIVIFGVISASFAEHDKVNLSYQGRQFSKIFDSIGGGLSGISKGFFGTNEQPPVYPIPAYPGGGVLYPARSSTQHDKGNLTVQARQLDKIVSSVGDGIAGISEGFFGTNKKPTYPIPAYPYAARSHKTENPNHVSQTKIHQLKARQANHVSQAVGDFFAGLASSILGGKQQQQRPPVYYPVPQQYNVPGYYPVGRPTFTQSIPLSPQVPFSRSNPYVEDGAYGHSTDYSEYTVPVGREIETQDEPFESGLMTLEGHPRTDYVEFNQNPYRK